MRARSLWWCCVASAVSGCLHTAGDFAPRGELCNQADDDGDGREDEGLVGEQIETCNRLDDDCDGQVDEALDAPLAMNQVGVCWGLRQLCTAGGWTEPEYRSAPHFARVDVPCDGLDNDCDGRTDERIGPPDADPCNGLDDDCDDEQDEDGPCDVVYCADGTSTPPCNGCPAGTVVPTGWVCIPPGEFDMGTAVDAEEHRPTDLPLQRVRIDDAFLMSSTEVTRSAFLRAMGDDPSDDDGCETLPNPHDEPTPTWELCPVQRVTWERATDYADTLSRLSGFAPCYRDGDEPAPDCRGFRLPSEAEWEYAARAGTATRYSAGDDVSALEGIAWYADTAEDPIAPFEYSHHTRPVSALDPNPWGLFDMHGNVWEWVQDMLTQIGEIDGEPSVERIQRGGCITSPPHDLRSAARSWEAQNYAGRRVGFRLVRRLSAERPQCEGPL